MQPMIITEDNLWSRRAFIETASGGTAGSLIARIDITASYAHIYPQQKPQGQSLTKLTLSEASELVRSKKISPVELTQACLSRIDQINHKLNAFVTVTADSALAKGRQEGVAK